MGRGRVYVLLNTDRTFIVLVRYCSEFQKNSEREEVAGSSHTLVKKSSRNSNKMKFVRNVEISKGNQVNNSIFIETTKTLSIGCDT